MQLPPAQSSSSSDLTLPHPSTLSQSSLGGAGTSTSDWELSINDLSFSFHSNGCATCFGTACLSHPA